MKEKEYIKLAKTFSSAKAAFISLLLVEDKPKGLYRACLYDDPKRYNRPPSIVIEWFFAGEDKNDRAIFTTTEIKYKNI